VLIVCIAFIIARSSLTTYQTRAGSTPVGQGGWVKAVGERWLISDYSHIWTHLGLGLGSVRKREGAHIGDDFPRVPLFGLVLEVPDEPQLGSGLGSFT